MEPAFFSVYRPHILTTDQDATVAHLLSTPAAATTLMPAHRGDKNDKESRVLVAERIGLRSLPSIQPSIAVQLINLEAGGQHTWPGGLLALRVCRPVLPEQSQEKRDDNTNLFT